MRRRQYSGAIQALFTACAVTACTTDLTVLASPSEALPDAAVEPRDAAPGDSDAASPPPPRPVSFGRTIAAFEHTCAIRTDGVYCWGDNSAGQLGLGDREARIFPTKVAGMDEAREVCAGEKHSCALLADRSLYCWGNNARGELGQGDTLPSPMPTQVPGEFVRVACGGQRTCAIDRGFGLWCWGDNSEGQVRPETGAEFENALVPTLATIDRASTLITAVSVGQGHVCAIGSSGYLACWGRNSDQQLGLDSAVDPVRVPTQVAAIGYDRVSAGQTHSCGLLRNNTLLCWGSTSEGKLGIASPADAPTRTPTAVSSESRDFFEVSTNWFHSCALHGGAQTAEGNQLSCWGRNVEGQLGLGDTVQRDTPVDLGGGWDDVTVGHFHTCGRKNDDVYCWGKNDVGQLGLSDSDRRDAPEQLLFR